MTQFERGTSTDPFSVLAKQPDLFVPLMMGADIRKPPWNVGRIPDALTPREKADNYRAFVLGVPRVSWLWPASFFTSAAAGRPRSASYAGQPLHQAYVGHGSDVFAEWYAANPAYFIATPVTSLSGLALQRGDVLIFGGHSLIATGNGDEMTQMWWNRTQQRYMWYNDGQTGPTATVDADYAVTRDSLGTLIARWSGFRVEGIGFWKTPTQYRLREEYRTLGDFGYLKTG